MMTLPLALLALWGPSRPLVPSYSVRVLGPSFTLLYPDTLSAMTFLPSLAPRSRGFRFQTDPNMLIFWGAGFFAGAEGSYMSRRPSEAETDNSERFGEGQILLGFGNGQGFGMLLHYRNATKQHGQYHSLDSLNYEAKIRDTRSSPRLELRTSFIHGEGYVLFRLGQHRWSEETQSSRSLPPNQDESSFKFHVDTLWVQFVVGSVRKRSWGAWLIEAGVRASRSQWRTYTNAKTYENDSLTGSWVNKLSGTGEIEPGASLRIAGLMENEGGPYTFYLGVQGEIQAELKSVRGSRHPDVTVTLHVPMAVERKLQPFRFMVGTSLWLSGLYQHPWTGDPEGVRTEVSISKGSFPVLIETQFTPNLKVHILGSFLTHFLGISLQYQM